jgi:hypothetical protein
MRRAFALAVLASACAEHKPASNDAPALSLGTPSASTSNATSNATSTPTSNANANAKSDADDGAPRVWAKSRYVKVQPEPSTKGKWIGYLWVGGSARLKSTEPILTEPRAGRQSRPLGPSSGCPAWYGVEPRGYVCVDGEKATLDKNDPIVAALRSHAPHLSSPWPYFYGESKGLRRHKTLHDYPTPTWPASLMDTRSTLEPRSTVAWTNELEADGTSWLWTSDLAFVRKDRVRQFPRVEFKGVHLGTNAEATLPIAFMKRIAHTKYKVDDDDRMTATKDTWPRLGWVKLTGNTRKAGGLTFWEVDPPAGGTSGQGDNAAWLDARDAAIVQASPAPEGTQHHTWIEVAALQGWMIAYENDTPVFATLVSAGKLGAAKPDQRHDPPQPAATTPIGTFRIKEKFVTTTLQSGLDDGTDFIHSEVPWSQHFYDKYLLHTAYWHDQWGEGRSGGCVNLSPTDARWLFEWTEPRVPDGWHAMRAGESDEDSATLVVIHP